MERYVLVPEGCVCVFVSRELAKLYEDWTPVGTTLVGPPLARVEAKAGPVDDSTFVIDPQFRYVVTEE